MGCQTEVVIENNLTFSICTHDSDTGNLMDASAAPAYRVYEVETGTPILNGTMSVLDNINTTGFYSELIACTAANGFEVGKSYNTYIEATVDGITGGISYAFTVKTASTDVTMSAAERNSLADAVNSRALAAESYAADGGTPTLSQMLWMIWAGLVDFSIAGSTLTVNKQDGTPAMTFTLNDPSYPTSRTRAT